MEAVRGSIMAEFLTVRREMSVQMHGTSVSSCLKTVSRRLLAAPPSTACTSGQHNLVHRISKSSLSFKDGVQSCKSWIVNGKFQQTRNQFAGSLKVRSSQYENVIPLPVDNELASLESLLEVSPSQPKLSPPSPADERNQRLEALIERVIFDCRFLTLMAVVGSLAGSLLCFFKGSLFVVESFVEYFQATWQGLGTSQVIFLLVEAVDVYLMGTVMLIFGMGLYELFVSTLEVAGESGGEVRSCGSNLFGLFRLRERPKWLEIRSLDELKTKLGHVIVMILLVGMFEKSKKVPINSGLDFLCFSASILLASGCLYLLSKLHNGTHK